MNVRVIGVGKACRNFDGVIVEVIQLDKRKDFKVKWSTGVIGIYHSRMLSVWTPTPALVANLNAERNFQPVPAADIDEQNNEPNDGKSSRDESDANASSSNYGSR